MFILNTFSVPCTQIGWIEAKLQNGNRWEGRSADFNIHEVVQGSPGADGGFHLSESFRLAVSVTHPINRFNLGLSTGRDTAVWDAISASMPCEIVGMSSTFCKSGCLILSVELKIPKLFYSLKKNETEKRCDGSTMWTGSHVQLTITSALLITLQWNLNHSIVLKIRYNYSFKSKVIR